MIRRRIFEIIEPANKNDIPSRIFDISIIFIIIINILSAIIESFESCKMTFSRELYLLEIVSALLFTIEYFLRLVTSDLLFSNDRKIKSVIKYIFSPMALIDLLVLLPFFLPMLISTDLRVLRVLRLIRILRVFKINRYTKSLKLLISVLKKKKEELTVTFFITFLLLLLSSSLMYLLEGDEQPKLFPNIIATFWWAVATLTTVGYGDVYPVTVMGKILSGIIALLGIGLVALPTGIISSGFISELNRNNDDMKRRKRVKKVKKYKRKITKIMSKKFN